MKLFMFAVYDSASKLYDRPFCCRSEGEALRSFGDIASDAEHPIGKHPEHYSLWEVGMYDDNKAKIDPVVARHVASAHELVAARRVIPEGQLDAFNDGLDNDGYPLNGGESRAT